MRFEIVSPIGCVLMQFETLEEAEDALDRLEDPGLVIRDNGDNPTE